MKIAIIRLSALGDIIQSSIVLQFIRQAHPNSSVDWFVDERFKGILEKHPLINKLYALPLKDRKIFKVLQILLNARKNRYDIVVDLQGLLKSAVIAKIVGANTFGFDKNSLKESLASLFYRHKKAMKYSENIILRNVALIGFALEKDFGKDDILGKEPCFVADERVKDKLALKFDFDFEKTSPKILIHTGSSSANKNYPKERHCILCALLLARYKRAKIILAWGNENEKKACKFIIKDCAKAGIVLAPKLSLPQLIALSSMCDLIIGNDSGPTHLAFAINKPSITIFGATPSYRNAYQTPINKVIDSGKYISDTKHIDKSDFCIQNIDEKEIFTLCEGLLK